MACPIMTNVTTGTQGSAIKQHKKTNLPLHTPRERNFANLTSSVVRVLDLESQGFRVGASLEAETFYAPAIRRMVEGH